MPNDLRFKWLGSQLIYISNDFVQRSFAARFPSKRTLWSSKTKLLCEIKWSLEAQKQSFSARLPSNLKFLSSKTKLLCEIPLKNQALKLKTEAFLRNFLQKWHVDQILDLRIPIHLSDFWIDVSKVLRLPQKKIESRHTKSTIACQVIFPWYEISNPSTDSASEASYTDITELEIIAPATRHASFRNLFKSTTPNFFFQPSRNPAPAAYFAMCRNPCACHAKSILNLQKRPETVNFSRFWFPNRSRAQVWSKFCGARLPKVLRTCNAVPLSTEAALARRRGANFAEPNFQKCSEHAAWCLFSAEIALACKRGANFAEFNFQKCSEPANY